MKYQQLTEGQRYQIALLYGESFSCRDMGYGSGSVSRRFPVNSGETALPMVMHLHEAEQRLF